MVIAKIDRLSRSVGDWNRLVDRYFGPLKGKKAGKMLFSFGESIDTSTAGGRMVLNVMMTMAQIRTRDDRGTDARRPGRQAVARRADGKVPYGFDLAADGVKLVANHDEQDIIAAILGWSEAGWSNREIARQLTDSDVATKGGDPAWSDTTIARI